LTQYLLNKIREFLASRRFRAWYRVRMCVWWRVLYAQL
jgi:hypothetical protein